MSDQDVNDAALRHAFQALAETSAAECSDQDAALVWRAVHGDLEPESRRALVERIAAEPALAEAWRLAQAFERPPVQPAAVGARSRAWVPSWLAAAALVVLGVAGAMLVSQRSPADIETMRGAGDDPVQSLLGLDAVLPRDGFILRWRPGPEGSRYQVRVTTLDLRVLTTTSDLSGSEMLVSSEALGSVPSGARVLWQVEVTLPSGARVTSETFVVRMQ